eukprot:CAMPEP_0203955258 /NCGR_PEP_ID=MMETSP0359-20131031/87955_1 /ASSEMBLY_ACC=CAM_ASM_000338 /TAXON_ID=268821 /ORGANISM="Scrippsiella Hangoei, Strain SHTV-5" /LENGTH=101 /DNA_ID=CAMNT_0050888859 /DNA_START=107 /DNA_END=412 /DNA_ORIENTATION=+
MRTLSAGSTVRAVRRWSWLSQDHHHPDHVADDGLQITLRRIVQNVRPEIVQNVWPEIVQDVWPEIVRTIGRQTVLCEDDKMKIAKASTPEGSEGALEMDSG